MTQVAELWQKALPDVKKGVTGVGIWTALNAVVPVLLEDGVLVLGLDSNEMELAGHLRMPQTARVIESVIRKQTGVQVSVRVIEGTAAEDWERLKRREAESKRLQDHALEKSRAEMDARSSWDGAYEQLGRTYAGLHNKSLPQVRAKYFDEGASLLAQVVKRQGLADDLSERNFARCVERIAYYTEVPSTIVARHVLLLAAEH